MRTQNDTILVTGANGFLGQKVVSYLSSKKKKVRSVTRNQTNSSSILEDHIAIGDLGPDNDWTSALKDVGIVVHLAGRAHILQENVVDPLPLFRSVNKDATLNLAKQAAAHSVRRFIYISSIGVNGAATFSEPFQASDRPNPHSAYAVSKWEAEMALWKLAAETQMEIVVIRPPLILGKNPKGNLASLMKLIDKGIPLPFGLITDNRRDLISDSTLANLIYTCAYHPNAPGKTFLASDGKPLSTKAIIDQIAVLHNKPSRMLPVPQFVMSNALRLLGREPLADQLFGDLEIDIRETCKTLDWTPTAPY